MRAFETYIGPWLPEPVDTSGDPRLGAERAEALEFGVLLLLEKLSPTERAAYILREAFDYSYDQIAHTIRSTEVNARQLVTRARKHISDGRRKAVSSAEQQRLLRAFVVASQKGDLPALEKLFASDAAKHFHSTNHPLIKSFEAEEEWGWCYIDELLLESVPGSLTEEWCGVLGATP